MDLLSSLIVPSEEALTKTYVQISSNQPEPKDVDNIIALSPSRLSNMGSTPLVTLAAATSMDLFLLPPSGQERHENVAPSKDYQVAGLTDLGLQDIDDFDQQHPYDPKPKLLPIHSGPISRDSTVKFQHACDQHGAKPIFTFAGDNLTGGFIAKLELGEHAVNSDAAYPTKKQAKEAACKLALTQFSFLAGVRSSKKRKSVDSSFEIDRSENWISILHEHVQAKKLPFPEYQEYATDKCPVQFGCTLTISGGRLTPFGTGEGPFSSKQTAKTAAAKEAVCWLRAQGILRAAPVERQTLAIRSTTPEQTGLTQAVDDVVMEDLSSLPAPVRLHRIAASLGFVPPRFDCQTSKTNPAPPVTGVPVYDATVYFEPRDVAKEPRLAGPIGRVEGIAGQKKAKAACYEQVILLLEQIQHNRLG